MHISFIQQFLNRFTYVGKLIFILYLSTICAVAISLVQLYLQKNLLNQLSLHLCGYDLIADINQLEFAYTSSLLKKSSHDRTIALNNIQERIAYYKTLEEKKPLFDILDELENRLTALQETDDNNSMLSLSAFLQLAGEERDKVQQRASLDLNPDSITASLSYFLTDLLPSIQDHILLIIINLNNINNKAGNIENEIRLRANLSFLQEDIISLSDISQTIKFKQSVYPSIDTSLFLEHLNETQNRLIPLAIKLAQSREEHLSLNQKELHTMTTALMESFAQVNIKSHQLLTGILHSYMGNIRFFYRLTLSITLSSLIAVIIMYATRLVRKPLDNLKKAADQLATGNLAVRVPITSNDEVGRISHQFNTMAKLFELIMIDARQITNDLAATTTKIFDTAKQLEHNILSQEQAIFQIAGNTKNITSTVQSFAKYLQDVYKTAITTARFAETGRASLIEMNAIMRQMVGSSNTIVNALSTFNLQVNKINNVISTIIKIADQSNLLSLNTAIRAKKSGLTGIGFSIVAEKIRELANLTANATLEIEEVVTDIIHVVNKAVDEVNNFSDTVMKQVDDEKYIGDQLKEVIEHTQKQIHTIDEVNMGMQEQAQRANQIQNALTQLINGAQNATTSIRKLFQEIEVLYRVTNNLQTMINKFSIGNTQ